MKPEARVVERQSYGYFITITGAKFEEFVAIVSQTIERIQQAST